MPRSPEQGRGRRARRDGGFTVVEVVVAIGILGTLVLATLPALLGGITANAHARLTTQAKALALAELERMRNLPWHVAPDAGDFVDVLDRYYPDLRPPAAAPACTDATGRFLAPTTASRGYVTTGARCSWEPPGPLYRQVRTDATDPDLDGFVVVVDTQLLTDASPPAVVTPPPGYDSATVGSDTPPAAQVGITVTVLPERRAVRRPLSTYSQVSRARQATTRIEAGVDVTALAVGTSVRRDVEVPLTVSAGLVRLASRLTYASSASALLSGLAAGLDTDEEERGATASGQAPPAGAVPSLGSSAGRLAAASPCALACWGGTAVVGGPVSSTGGLPRVGAPGAALSSAIGEPQDGPALRVGAGAGAAYRPELELEAPLVRMEVDAVGRDTGAGCTVLDAGPRVRVGASGWLRSTSRTDAAAPLVVDACATARTAPVSVLPTGFAPDGILRVRLLRASARCLVSGSAHAATTSIDYAATVERWTPSGYVEVATVTPATTSDPLAAVPLATTPVGDRGVLGDWIEDWSAITPARIRTTASGGVASVTLPGVVSVRTVPLRHATDATGTVVRADGAPVPEPASTLSLTVGALSCSASDAR